MLFLQEPKKTGFTLIELLVAISILLIIVSITYSSFNSTHDIINRVEGGMKNYHTAQRFFARLRDEIISLRWEQGNNYLEFTGTDGLYAEGDSDFEPDEEEEVDQETVHMDSLVFTTLLHPIQANDGPVESDLKIVEYFSTTPDEDGLFSVIYTRKSVVGPMRYRSFEIADRVENFNLRYCKSTKCGYYDDDNNRSSWREAWNMTQENALPRLIEVNLTLADTNNNKQRFRDVIKLLLPI